jgi:hypothetical protein
MTIEQTYKAVKPTDCVWWLVGNYYSCRCEQCENAIRHDDELRQRGEVPGIGAG